MPENSETLSLDRVSFHYGTRVVIDNVTLQIPRQSFFALIGPNGSGKTTLLRLMSRTLEPRKGEIRLEGRKLPDFTARQLAQKIAVITSEQYFEFPFSVFEIVAMGRYPHLDRFARMSQLDEDTIDQALRLTQTESLRLRAISELSSGERQRVLIARALAQQPSILMLDEPNAHLDIHHQVAIFNLLRRLNRGRLMTILVVLHDLTAASAFCEKLILLQAGRLVKVGTPKEVLTSELIRQCYGAEVSVYRSPLGNFPQVAYAPADEPAGTETP